MSDQVLALGLTIAFFALLAALVPLLDFLQRRRAARKLRLVRNPDRFHTRAGIRDPEDRCRTLP